MLDGSFKPTHKSKVGANAGEEITDPNKVSALKILGLSIPIAQKRRAGDTIRIGKRQYRVAPDGSLRGSHRPRGNKKERRRLRAVNRAKAEAARKAIADGKGKPDGTD